MKIPHPDQVAPAGSLDRVHFIGIGGAGLSGIARLMLARGVRVSGSDGSDSAVLDRLRAEGAEVFVGHAADQLPQADAVVVSTAVPEDNPEVVAARERGVALWPRSAGVVSVMAGQRALAITGTHGKTTTTSLLTMALRAAGLDPSYAVGGDLAQTGRNAELGTGDYFVIEADESDGAFLRYAPYAAIVTNVDGDHLDHFGSLEAYRQAFTEFVATIDPAGCLVAVVDDPGAAALREVARERGLRFVGVGETDAADVRVSDLELAGGATRFTLSTQGRTLGEVRLRIPGRHYAVDAAAAIALGMELGCDFSALVAGANGFRGTSRRMEFKGEVGGVRVYDSYAHHPSEIVGDLESARSLVDDGRLLVVFQPHLVSRTRVFAEQMGAALAAADQALVLDVYLAREAADPAVTGALVADAGGPTVRFEPDFEAAPSVLAAMARPGDVVLTLGAGTVTQLGPRVLACLREGL